MKRRKVYGILKEKRNRGILAQKQHKKGPFSYVIYRLSFIFVGAFASIVNKHKVREARFKSLVH